MYVEFSTQTSRKEITLTRNQISYWELQETTRNHMAVERETNRSNLAKEKENARHNMAVESETNRSNLANEKQARINSNRAYENAILDRRRQIRNDWQVYTNNRLNLAENARHNKVVEAQQQSNLANQAYELSIREAQLKETSRANLAREANDRLSIQNLGKYQQQQISLSKQQLQETVRNNTLANLIKAGTLSETRRSNISRENIQRMETNVKVKTLNETNRHNIAQENEVQRHNKSLEELEAIKAAISLSGQITSLAKVFQGGYSYAR